MQKNLLVAAFAVPLLTTACSLLPQSAPSARNAPELASEMGQISRSYDFYNAELKELSLPDPDSLLFPVTAGFRTDGLKRYYTKEMNQKRDRCYSDSSCRKSDIMGLRAQTMGSYRVVSLHQRDENLVTLMILGTNTRGAERRVIVDWLFEDGRWRINDVVSGPPG